LLRDQALLLGVGQATLFGPPLLLHSRLLTLVAQSRATAFVVARRFAALLRDPLRGIAPFAGTFNHLTLPGLALGSLALLGGHALLPLLGLAFGRHARTLLFACALLDHLPFPCLAFAMRTLLAYLLGTLLGLRILAHPLGTLLGLRVLAHLVGALLGLRVLAHLLGATSGLLAAGLGPPLHRDIGLCLALVLLRLLARLITLLLVVLVLLLLRCRGLTSERRCPDAERQRCADHGGQHGTVDGVIDVHGDPRCCLRTSSSCSGRTTREIHLTTSECFRPHSAAVRLPESGGFVFRAAKPLIAGGE
jgi:hypothetical protein